jgi:hypothetical protein
MLNQHDTGTIPALTTGKKDGMSESLSLGTGRELRWNPPIVRLLFLTNGAKPTMTFTERGKRKLYS